ncbi:MAG: hypothetical protein SF182_21675 [Deltaproteobacteria bacterium]|nr:hypothetical protein [Deltaproteobacteria bacterium]
MIGRLLLGLASLCIPAAASAAVDLTGSWLSTIYVGTTIQLDLLQSGTTLTMTQEIGPPDHGTIDPATGVFHFDLQFTDELCGVELDGVAAADGNSFTATLSVRQLTFSGCQPPQQFPVSGTRCPSCVPFTCGDGTLGDGEACDDGDRYGGDCCSASCTLIAAGTTCDADADPCTADQCDGAGACTVSGPSVAGTARADDGSACTADVCDGAGACTHAPRSSCRRASRSARLDVRRAAARSRVTLVWRDASGSTTPADLGDPTAVTTVRLCVFSGATLMLDAEAPAASGCGSPPCWTGRANGFAYKSRTGAPDGVNKLVLKSTPSGRSTLLVKGTGAALPFLGDANGPLRAQLLASDAAGSRCWEVP